MYFVQKYIHVSNTIMELHKDKDGLRKEEIQVRLNHVLNEVAVGILRVCSRYIAIISI